MAAHAVVQAGAAGGEAVGLGVVHALDQAHEFAGDVAVEPGRTEGVFHCQDARREDGEVHVGRARGIGRGGQHREDRRVRMVVADRADGVEVAQVVLVRRVRAVPGDHVQRRMADRGAPEAAGELGDQFEVAFHVFVPGHRRLEVAGIGQAVRADRAQFGQAQRGAEVLQHVAARAVVQQLHAEAHAARDHGDLQRLQVDQAQFGGQAQAALLRHQQQLAVGVVEIAALHRAVGGIQVDADAALFIGAAVAAPGLHAFDEVGGRGGNGQGAPAQLVGRDRAVAERAFPALDAGKRLERLVLRARADAVEPGAAVLAARRGEGGAG
ncbi:Uncharacterised protein [Achromobacter xylosoxidans]|nr:Uncharacterised protein [Achromobacter xylosoxidans]